MPVTLMDRLPLPNLKVYSAGSVVLLAAAVYHAVGVTSDPAWRANATAARDPAAPGDQLPVAPAVTLSSNETRNVTEQFVDVMTFMMQEPLCMWAIRRLLTHFVLFLDLLINSIQHMYNT